MKYALTKQASVDLFTAHLWFEVMEEQKENLRALISVLRGILDTPEISQDVRTLLAITADTCEDHKAWYKLREALGMKPGRQKGDGDE
ncbi:MAG: hypothetical protein J0I68_28630 [Achromobacter sp.]|uniref:hypothetical protein n=1 Tax=unclassified Achromobacter TaxID=2626865 RepID=UPI0006BF03B0|nr:MULTISPECIES: hypothetical protein [unclassified Achromobacter]MBN9642527.1 hypothetical protein [Achromobacter sp.]CUJ43286.1 Uncharacterised protein [Achromobacter sp. 2789STDY5608621]